MGCRHLGGLVNGRCWACGRRVKDFRQLKRHPFLRKIMWDEGEKVEEVSVIEFVLGKSRE